MLRVCLSATGLPAVKSTWESLLELLGVIIIFIIVVVACYYTTRFVAGKQVKNRRNGNIELIETYSIAQNKYLQLLKVGKKYIVISVSKDNITLLTELNEDEIEKFENNPVQPQVSFKEVFNNILKKNNAAGEASEESKEK